MRLVNALLATAMLLVLPSGADANTYGQTMPAGEALPVAAILADPASHAGQVLKLRGRIGRVCQRTGCSLMLEEAGRGLSVRTGHAFFVPKNASGNAVVYGELKPVAIDTAEAEREWQLIATSIVIEGLR